MCGRRLPVAPRPHRDELLSSWLGRVACRYGLDAASLVGALAAEGDARGIPIDDAAPTQEHIVSWAHAGGVDPARLSLSWRYPDRPPAWLSSQGPPWAPTAVRSPPACRACFEADRAAGRDEHLRADWMLAERCACPAHRRLLLDHCPGCREPLHFAFRLRDGWARLVCGRCEQELTARSGREDSALMEALISIQDRRIGAIVSVAPERRRRLEAALSTLWAPLDDPGAARPVLALWLDESGWRCPAEAQDVIGAPFPLGRLPIALRIATLIAAEAAFGLGGELLDHESDAAAFLTRRAAPLRGFPKTPRSAPAVAASARRSPTEYGRLARNPDESGMESRRRAARARFVAIDGRRARRPAG